MNGGFDQGPTQQDLFGMNGGYGGPTPGSDVAQAGFLDDSSAAVAPEPATPAPTDPALFSMNTLSGSDQPLVEKYADGAPKGNLADQAYAKLVNMDAFDLVQDKGAHSRNNPFDMASTNSSTVGATGSLADMQSKKKTGEKKEIMRSYAPAPGAMVISSNQQGNFGGYGSQYGSNVGQQQPSMGGPPPMQGGYGGGYGGMQVPSQQPPAYGQAPTQPQPGYGMQQPQYPMQQPYGMPQQQQQQQQHYGQPPPLQQQPFGF
jgi:hypothetical protein